VSTFRSQRNVLNSTSGWPPLRRPTWSAGRLDGGGHRARPVQSRGIAKPHPSRSAQTARVGDRIGLCPQVSAAGPGSQAATRLEALPSGRALRTPPPTQASPAALRPGAKRQICGAAFLAAARQGGRCGLRPRSGLSRRLCRRHLRRLGGFPLTPSARRRLAPARHRRASLAELKQRRWRIRQESLQRDGNEIYCISWKGLALLFRKS